MEKNRTPVNFDGKTVYLPDVSIMRPGDIMLTSNEISEDRLGLKTSALIRKLTRGSFSHALICSSPPTFVEAIGPGVSTLSLANCYVFAIKNVRLLRYPDERIARRAAQLAQYEIGRSYSKARAAASVFPLHTLDRIEDHGIFCSALVAQVFLSAGGSLFDKTPVDRTTPATIEKMVGLADLTKSAFRAALAPRNIETMSSLDGDRAPTPSERQTRISAECVERYWPTVDSLAKAHPELKLESAPTLNGILEFIVKGIDRANTLPAFRRAAFEKAIASLDSEMEKFINSGALNEMYRIVEVHDGAIMQRNIEESYNSNPDIDTQAMRGLLVAGEMQLVQRDTAIANFEKWGLQRSNALAANVAFERRAASFVRSRNILLREIIQRIHAL